VPGPPCPKCGEPTSPKLSRCDECGFDYTPYRKEYITTESCSACDGDGWIFHDCTTFGHYRPCSGCDQTGFLGAFREGSYDLRFGKFCSTPTIHRYAAKKKPKKVLSKRLKDKEWSRPELEIERCPGVARLGSTKAKRGRYGEACYCDFCGAHLTGIAIKPGKPCYNTYTNEYIEKLRAEKLYGTIGGAIFFIVVLVIIGIILALTKMQ